MKKSLKILDAGCAKGRDYSEIAKEGFEIIGIDYNNKFLNDAKKKYPKLKFEVGDINKLKYNNSEFDAVYCVNTLFYTNLNKSIPDLLRVLKKEGILFITLDEKIINLDKNKIIHSLNVDDTLNLLNGCVLGCKVRVTNLDKIFNVVEREICIF